LAARGCRRVNKSGFLEAGKGLSIAPAGQVSGGRWWWVAGGAGHFHECGRWGCDSSFARIWAAAAGGVAGELARVVTGCFVSTPGPFGVSPSGEGDHLPLPSTPAAVQCCRRGLIPSQIPWLQGLLEKCLLRHPPSLAIGAELVQLALALPLPWLLDVSAAGWCPLTGITICFL